VEVGWVAVGGSGGFYARLDQSLDRVQVEVVRRLVEQ